MYALKTANINRTRTRFQEPSTQRSALRAKPSSAGITPRTTGYKLIVWGEHLNGQNDGVLFNWTVRIITTIIPSNNSITEATTTLVVTLRPHLVVVNISSTILLD